MTAALPPHLPDEPLDRAPGLREHLRGVRVADTAAQPWKNGGGLTHELLTWPPSAAAADWQLRISVARIDADGPFSAFPGVQRGFAVLQGAGVKLSFSEQIIECRRGQDALFFDGHAAPGCQLIDGPTLDLNLMVRGGHGHMRRVWASQPESAQTPPGITQRGLFTVSGGSLGITPVEIEVPAMTLWWCDGGPALASEWRFCPADATAPSFWIAFTPAPVTPPTDSPATA